MLYDAVALSVARVVTVDPNQFKVISHSVKKTDPNDARNLALYREKDLLPEVRMKDKTQAQFAKRRRGTPRNFRLSESLPESTTSDCACIAKSRCTGRISRRRGCEFRAGSRRTGGQLGVKLQ